MENYSKGGKGLLCKAKSIVSSVYGFFLRTSTLPSPMTRMQLLAIPKDKCCPPPSHHGLKTLIYSTQDQDQSLSCLILHSYLIPPNYDNLPSTAATCSSIFRSSASTHHFSSNSTLDDLIGTESGVCLKANHDQLLSQEMEQKDDHNNQIRKEDMDNNNNNNNNNIPRIMLISRRKKMFPPPIPLLARTGNLPGHMPWVLTRHYTQGKLILKEERVKHHEYFEAHRDNGRLLLNLVSLDDEVNKCCHKNCAIEFDKKNHQQADIDDQEPELLLQELDYFIIQDHDKEYPEEEVKEDEDEGHLEEEEENDVQSERFASDHENVGRKCLTYIDGKMMMGWSSNNFKFNYHLSCNAKAAAACACIAHSGTSSAPLVWCR